MSGPNMICASCSLPVADCLPECRCKCGQLRKAHGFGAEKLTSEFECRYHAELVVETYPCEKCGRPRTKAEGATTFTVCDECWSPIAAKCECKGFVLGKRVHLSGCPIRVAKELTERLRDVPPDYAAEIEALKAERDAQRTQLTGYVFEGIQHYPISRTGKHDPLICVGCLRAEVARLEGLIVTAYCRFRGYPDEANVCDGNCSDSELHAEARAIKARATGA